MTSTQPASIGPTGLSFALSAAFVLSAFASGCPSPDAAGKFDRFNEQTEDDREMPEMPDMGTPMPPMPMPGTGSDTESGGPEPLELDGVYLVAVSTIVDPQKPLQFLAQVDAEQDIDGNGPVTVEFQPLSLDVGSTTEPREEVGEAITIEAEMTAYQFELPFGLLSVTGEANPITGALIESDITLSGSIVDVDTWCGTVDGEVLSPIQVPLAGSTFGAVRLADRDERPADGEFLLACP